MDRVRVRLRAATTRYWGACGLSAVLTLLGVAVTLGTGHSDPFSASFITGTYFVAWILFCLFYSASTWRTFMAADGPTLAAWLQETAVQRRSRQRSESLYGTGGPSGAVMLCVIALAAVLATVVLPELQDSLVTLGLTVVVVAASWCLLLVVYALHYARESVHVGGVAFPGHTEQDTPGFADFVYLAASVATGFAAADVEVRTTAMRREITIHALIAFAFNTVVVALLVSLLITVGD